MADLEVLLPSEKSIASAMLALRGAVSSRLDLDLSNYSPNPAKTTPEPRSAEKNNISCEDGGSLDPTPSKYQEVTKPSSDVKHAGNRVFDVAPAGCSWADLMDSESDLGDLADLEPLPSNANPQTPPQSKVSPFVQTLMTASTLPKSEVKPFTLQTPDTRNLSFEEHSRRTSGAFTRSPPMTIPKRPNFVEPSPPVKPLSFADAVKHNLPNKASTINHNLALTPAKNETTSVNKPNDGETRPSSLPGVSDDDDNMGDFDQRSESTTEAVQVSVVTTTPAEDKSGWSWLDRANGFKAPPPTQASPDKANVVATNTCLAVTRLTAVPRSTHKNEAVPECCLHPKEEAQVPEPKANIQRAPSPKPDWSWSDIARGHKPPCAELPLAESESETMPLPKEEDPGVSSPKVTASETLTTPEQEAPQSRVPFPTIELMAEKNVQVATDPPASSPLRGSWADRVRGHVETEFQPKEGPQQSVFSSQEEVAAEPEARKPEDSDPEDLVPLNEKDELQAKSCEEVPVIAKTPKDDEAWETCKVLKKKGKAHPELSRTPSKLARASRPPSSRPRKPLVTKAPCPTLSTRVALTPAPWAPKSEQPPGASALCSSEAVDEPGTVVLEIFVDIQKITSQPLSTSLSESSSPSSSGAELSYNKAEPLTSSNPERSAHAVSNSLSKEREVPAPAPGFPALVEPGFCLTRAQTNLPERSWVELVKACTPDPRKVRPRHEDPIAEEPCPRGSAQPAQTPGSQLVWIGSLRVRHDVNWLQELLGPYGLIRVVEREAGYAICEFPTDSVERVTRSFHNVKVDGKKFVVRLSTRSA